ncbi:hypothetical protein HNR19_003794 [Nocardioides thalensis]|uniref:Uncharacterized protein n=1 Tax=Nocardioides thalensis TaxID=1914755 RepID=A0A853C7V4_9ACTN|nr:hypothetical protein [Nocardioides thalensis]NYJ03096.1 hypothetical protein [Nocardioides thalensis]
MGEPPAGRADDRSTRGQRRGRRRARLALGVEQSGLLAGLLGVLLGGRIRSYVDMECRDLTAAAAASR